MKRAMLEVVTLNRRLVEVDEANVAKEKEINGKLELMKKAWKKREDDWVCRVCHPFSSFCGRSFFLLIFCFAFLPCSFCQETARIVNFEGTSQAALPFTSTLW